MEVQRVLINMYLKFFKCDFSQVTSKIIFKNFELNAVFKLIKFLTLKTNFLT